MALKHYPTRLPVARRQRARKITYNDDHPCRAIRRGRRQGRRPAAGGRRARRCRLRYGGSSGIRQGSGIAAERVGEQSRDFLAAHAPDLAEEPEYPGRQIALLERRRPARWTCSPAESMTSGSLPLPGASATRVEFTSSFIDPKMRDQRKRPDPLASPCRRQAQVEETRRVLRVCDAADHAIDDQLSRSSGALPRK